MRKTVQFFTIIILSAISLQAQNGVFHASAVTDPEVQISAAAGVVSRTAPGALEWFELDVDPQLGIKSLSHEGGAFLVESAGARIRITGTDGVALCSGFNYYIKHIAKKQISWDSPVVVLELPLPQPEKPVFKSSRFDLRYYFNYCTFGYSTPFWGEKRWRQEIDWMALHGINMPLALTGQESVWRELYLEIGLEDEDLAPFFTGPAFLPWFWMRNLDGWGGPLPQWWYERQKKLQQFILHEQRALGMTPVLPAFNGHVPEAFSKIAGEKGMLKDGGWCGFEGNWMISPSDPAFSELGTAFLKKQAELYGSDHYYSADIYNENHPQKRSRRFLTSVAQKVYGSMVAADPESVWVMQGWIYVNDGAFWTTRRSSWFLGAIPDDRLIMLDLFSTAKPAWNRREAFHGKRWIYNQLHNWGGKQGMYGRLHKMAAEPLELLDNPDAGRLSGIGLAPEGIETNPVVYDFFGDLVWHSAPVELEQWMRDYAHRRYGEQSAATEAAWQILSDQLYQCPTLRHGPQGSYFCMRPSLSTHKSWVRAEIWYDTEKVLEALKLLASQYPQLGTVSRYRYDLVDLGRQVLSDFSQVLHAEIKRAALNRDADALELAAKRWILAMELSDRLLSCHPEFTVGSWLEPALEAADSAADVESASAWTEFNARNLITLWGPEESMLHDYAQRQYSGLMKDFYLPRWKLFLDMQITAIRNNRVFIQSDFDAAVQQLEMQWSLKRNPYSQQAEGELSEIIKELISFVEG